MAINLAFKGPRVLVVEDMEMNRILMARILGRLGCDATMISRGKDALELISAFDYDLVFMDCHMSEMDGLETTRRIRNMERASGKHVTIVALTADTLAEDRANCRKAGMDDHIGKPFTLVQIAAMLEKWAGPAA